jgi:hypothetical protein
VDDARGRQRPYPERLEWRPTENLLGVWRTSTAAAPASSPSTPTASTPSAPASSAGNGVGFAEQYRHIHLHRGSNLVANLASGAGGSLTRTNNSHSGTGDFRANVTITDGPVTFIGFVNASCPTDGSTTPLSSNKFIGAWNNGAGLWWSGANIGSITYVDGDTVNLALINGFAYFGCQRDVGYRQSGHAQRRH